MLEGLDPDRKQILLLFLYESGLIDKDKPVVSLVAANLSGANLSKADLHGAILLEANLSKAELWGADLRKASLREATGITNEELEQMAYSLEGAIMPDGSRND